MRIRITTTICALCWALTSLKATPSSSGDVEPAGVRSTSHVEDVYILRSLREHRDPAGEFCAQSKIGFDAKVEDHYVFKAVATRASDGKVIDAISRSAGSLHGCFESAPGAGDTNFYAEGIFAGVRATGKGKCTPIIPNHPEPGIASVRCFLVLSDLPPPYIAGTLTTSSVTSRQPIGAESDPPGYIQPSIATIRLWRKR